MNFIVKKTSNKSLGLYSNKYFEKNEVLFKFEGTKLSRQEALMSQENNKLIQIGSNLFLDATGHFGAMINHSCNPNCFIKISSGTAFLVSYIPISIGDELTFDYSTTSSDSPEEWSMPCNCSIFGCRKNISGFNSLSDVQKNIYIKQGFIPNYLK